MDTLVKQEQEAPVKVGRVARIRARVAGRMASVFAMVTLFVGGGASMAHAEPVDPTGGAGETFKTDLLAWVTGHGFPILGGLLVVGAIAVVLVKYARKGARAL